MSASEQQAQREQQQAGAPPRPPPVVFDPATSGDASMPESIDPAIVEGLRAHLQRYGSHQHVKASLGRLEDPVWTSAWSTALDAMTAGKILFVGSELGVFAARALEQGERMAFVAERSALESRIAGGILQKHFLKKWHSLHGPAIRKWPEEEGRKSFEEFTRNVDVLEPESPRLRERQCDALIFPDIDHSLLGTGIVKAVRELKATALAPAALILPSAARVFATAVQWKYAASPFALEAVNDLRWSPYPHALQLPPESWIELTEPLPVGELRFDDFQETEWHLDLRVVRDGQVDGILFWFDLSPGGVVISNAPGSGLKCIKPAVQYTDPIPVRTGEALGVRVRVAETRLHFEVPAAPNTQPRKCLLPGWYVPMLQDKERNDAYGKAIDAAVRAGPAPKVLDIGAGPGLLSLLAAHWGATHVTGCEISSHIADVGRSVVARNGLEDRISIVNKDCRALQLGSDVPERADLAVFEMFDCSLVGEGILHFLAYARENLLTRDARYVPRSAKLRAMVIEHRVDSVLGCDVNLLNPYRFSPRFINVDAGELEYRTLTEAFDVFSVDFRTATPEAQKQTLSVRTVADGTAGAMLFWFDLEVEEGRWLSNDPAVHGTLHWKQGLQYLPEVQVSRSMELPIVAAHNGSSLTFNWERERLATQAFSRLPRFDPRWMQQCTELELQTRGMLEHCLRNPEEYLKVARAAQSFAADPAAYDIDPAIAQRFAATFFQP